MLSYGNFQIQKDHITSEDKIKASLITEVIKNGLVTIMIEGRTYELRSFVETLVAEDLGPVRLYAPDGKIIASSMPGESGTRSESVSFESRQVNPELSVREINGTNYFQILIPFYNEKPCQSCHSTDVDILSVLNVSVSMDKTMRRISELKHGMILYFLIALGTVIVSLGAMTTIFVNKPIKHVVETMKRVEQGDLEARYPVRANDEIGRLGEGLNSMISEMGRMSRKLEASHVEAMRKVEKMATIGELAAAIAHEIKNPLAGISGAIQVFSEDFPEGDPRREVISEIQNEIERLDKAVRDLLSYAKPPKPHMIKTPVGELVERAVRLVQSQARKQGVSVNVLSLDGEGEVHVDAEQIQQVFLNVIINALHSMPGGGSLTISTHIREDDGTAEISLSDTGPGISRENAENIFKPFFTTKHTGTGLGLAISKQIVENHGGNISVESEVGRGSNFRIILPLAKEDA